MAASCLKVGASFYIFVADACKGNYFGRNLLARIYVEVLAVFSSIRHYLDVRNLYNTILDHVKTGCLQVEHDQRLC